MNATDASPYINYESFGLKLNKQGERLNQALKRFKDNLSSTYLF